MVSDTIYFFVQKNCSLPLNICEQTKYVMCIQHNGVLEDIMKQNIFFKNPLKHHSPLEKEISERNFSITQTEFFSSKFWLD